MHAFTGKRLAEDYLLTSFMDASQRSTFSGPGPEAVPQECLAVVIMANYLSDRGQVSEAWKIVGYAVRNAQSAGLHRNPNNVVWKEMDEGTREIRRTAWLLLSQTDK